MEQLRKGYKKTEVGVIPEDWSLGTLGKLCLKVTDGTHDTPKPTKEGVPFITAIHVQENCIHVEDCYFLPQSVHSEIYKRCNPEKDDVLMVNIGAGVGTTALVNVNYEFSLKNVALLKSSPRLYGSYLNSILIYRKNKILNDFIAGGAQPFLSLGQISKIEIPLPPTLTEQKAIADALSDVDALIANLEKLIAKKKAIKQGAMQQLLTPPHKGGKRLEGFSGEWKKLQLKNCLLIPATYGIVKAGYFLDSGVKMVRGGDIKNGKIILDEMPNVSQEKSNEFSRTILKKGDVLIALVGYPGETATIPDSLIGHNISRAVGLLRLNKTLNSSFLVQLLNSESGRKAVLAPSAGSAQLVVNLDALNKLYIDVPTLEEQNEIARILNFMDTEIDELERKKEKYDLIKQGMMQELLTGKTRLI